MLTGCLGSSMHCRGCRWLGCHGRPPAGDVRWLCSCSPIFLSRLKASFRDKSGSHLQSIYRSVQLDVEGHPWRPDLHCLLDGIAVFVLDWNSELWCRWQGDSLSLPMEEDQWRGPGSLLLQAVVFGAVSVVPVSLSRIVIFWVCLKIVVLVWHSLYGFAYILFSC